MPQKIAHIDVDEIELKKILGSISLGLENPSISSAIALARINFRKLRDYALCPHCHGNGCDNCDNTGHLV